MEDLTKTEEVTANLKQYLNTSIELIKMEVIESTTIIASSMASGLILASVGIFCILFLSLAAAFLLSIFLSSFCLGFLYVGLFYLLLWLIFFIGRNKFFETPISNKIIHKVFAKKVF